MPSFQIATDLTDAQLRSVLFSRSWRVTRIGRPFKNKTIATIVYEPIDPADMSDPAYEYLQGWSDALTAIHRGRPHAAN